MYSFTVGSKKNSGTTVIFKSAAMAIGCLALAIAVLAPCQDASAADYIIEGDGENAQLVVTDIYDYDDLLLFKETVVGQAEKPEGGTYKKCDYSGKTVLIREDINCGGAVWHKGIGSTNPFKGRLEGVGEGAFQTLVNQERTISNLRIGLEDVDNVGLFSNTGDGCSFAYIALEDIQVTGNNNVGMLVGSADGNTRTYTVAAKGDSTVNGHENVSALIGYINLHRGDSLDISYTTIGGGHFDFDVPGKGAVKVEGGSNVGSYVGYVNGVDEFWPLKRSWVHIYNCCLAMSNVALQGDNKVDGFIGMLDGGKCEIAPGCTFYGTINGKKS